MKKAILFLIIFVSMLGCSSEKDDTQNNQLFGNWKLMAFIDEANETFIMENDFENTGRFFIEFKNNFDIRGNTFRNNLLGKYAINNSEKILIFLELGTDTEINETDWGRLFFDKLHLNYDPSTRHYNNNYQLSENVLKLYYSDNEYMKFEKM